jgi:Rad3-related DNA helicase
MPEAMRKKTLAALAHGRAPTLLLAVSGGIFAEGIDLPGDALIGVIVVGPALPGIGVERELMRRYYQELNGDGFAYAMLYPGMQRVIQSAGRVIRSMEDKGVIVLLGRRFAARPYTACLPPDWCERGTSALLARDPVPRLRKFWADFPED